MGNFSALLFLALTFAIPMASPSVRADRGLYLTICFTLVMRHSLALINAFVTPLSSSWGDLYYFHDIGMGMFPTDGQPYGLFLRILYRIFGGSFWLGEESSVLAYSASTVLLVETATMLGLNQSRRFSVLLFGCMLSPAIHTSVTLRESLQCFGLMLAVFSLLKLRELASPHWLLGFVAGLAVLLFLHQGLSLYVFVLSMLGVPWALQGRGNLGGILAIMALLAVPLVAPKILNSLSSESSSARAFSEGRLMNYAANYRTGVGAARSDYGVKIDPSDAVSFASTVFLAMLMFFVAPLPWQVTHPMDLYALGENVIRTLLICGALYSFHQARREQRLRILLILASALGLECLWALGTTNWGTALRHHSVAWGLLVLVGAPAYASFTLDPEMASLQRRRRRRKLTEADP